MSALSLLYSRFAHVCRKRACQRDDNDDSNDDGVDDDDDDDATRRDATRTSATAATDEAPRRARGFQKGLSGRGVALSRGRRPRRSSHPPRRRGPPPRDRRSCWTVHASTSRARPLPLALSPVDSALTARAHICIRVPVSFSSLSLSFFRRSCCPYLSRPFLLRRFSRSYQARGLSTTHATDIHRASALFPSSLPLSFSLPCPRIAYNDGRACVLRGAARRAANRAGEGDRDVATMMTRRRRRRRRQRRTERARARARCPLRARVSSARVCTCVCAHFSISATRRA